MIHQIDAAIVGRKYVAYFALEVGYSLRWRTDNVFNLMRNPVTQIHLAIEDELRDR